MFGRLLDPRLSQGVPEESWILDPVEYRIFGYIPLYSGGSWIQDFPKESLRNLGSWIRPNTEYSDFFGYIQEVLKKIRVRHGHLGGPPPGKG